MRLRITPAELDEIGRQHAVRETLVVGKLAMWSASIEPSETESRLNADGRQNSIIISLGASDRAILANSGSEGVYLSDITTGIRYYIEKDFPCVHPRAVEALEPLSETFAPPDDFAERKSK